MCIHKRCHVQVAGGTQSETAALYNLTSSTYTPFHITEEAEAGGHILLPDGRGLMLGVASACLSICTGCPVWLPLSACLCQCARQSVCLPMCLSAHLAVHLHAC